MKNPQVTAFFDEPTNTVSYVVADPKAKACVIIDSVLGYDAASGRTNTVFADKIIAFVRESAFTVNLILETHVHADHLSAAPYLQEQIGGKTAIGNHIDTIQDVFGKIFNEDSAFQRDGSQFDVLLKDKDSFQIGAVSGYAVYTPGHTPACMTYVIGDAVFVGDTLFMPDYGTARTDFPGGDARQLYRSVKKILSLPQESRLFMCHDYKAPGRNTYQWETTIMEEKANNIHVHDGISEDEFVAMREARDSQLDMPKLILPSVQINMRAGQMPPPADNGLSYIKIPINAL